MGCAPVSLVQWGVSLTGKAVVSVLGQGTLHRVTWGDELAESSLGPRHWLRSEGGPGAQGRTVGRRKGD